MSLGYKFNISYYYKYDCFQWSLVIQILTWHSRYHFYEKDIEKQNREESDTNHAATLKSTLLLRNVGWAKMPYIHRIYGTFRIHVWINTTKTSQYFVITKVDQLCGIWLEKEGICV